jgi:hypothetical protein
MWHYRPRAKDAHMHMGRRGRIRIRIESVIIVERRGTCRRTSGVKEEERKARDQKEKGGRDRRGRKPIKSTPIQMMYHTYAATHAYLSKSKMVILTLANYHTWLIPHPTVKGTTGTSTLG